MTNLASLSKGTIVKKIALSLVALSALSLAACGGNTATSTNNVIGTQDAINQANSDIDNATAAMQNNMNAAGSALDNAANATASAAANTANAANNAVQNAAR